MNTHYTPSENIDTSRTIIAVVIALALVICLSFVYNAIVSFIPIVYLCVLAPIGYAIVLGLLTRAVVHFGKFRSQKKGIALAVLFGLAANYTQWYAYLDYIWLNDFNLSFGSYLGSLFGGLGWGDALRAVGVSNTYGSWSIGTSGTPVNGIILTLVWVVEFLVLLLYPVWTLRNNRSAPFSEEQDRFYDQFVLDNLFQGIYTPSKAEAGLVEDPLVYLQSIELNARHPGSRVEVYYLPNESNAYLSMLRTRVDEKNNEIAVPIVREFRISNRDAKRILDGFDHTKDLLNIFGD